MFGWWDQVDQLWVTEITEHSTREGKVYCAVVLDEHLSSVAQGSVAGSSNLSGQVGRGC